MTPGRLIGLVVCLAAAWGVLPETAGAAPGPPSASCNGGGCGGWFRSNVTVSWSYDPAGVTGTTGCGSVVVSEDTAGATFTCVVVYGGPFYGNSVSVAKDSSPPSANGTLARSPDGNGWYTSPVPFSFSGDGGASGISACSSGTYSGPDGGAVTISGSCTDGAGNTGSGSLTIKYDGTPPEVSAATNRPPDFAGWYNHAVQVAFTGKDGGSGVAECTQPVTYAGPDASPAKVVGQCRDAAGHVSPPATVELRYDGTKPARPNVKMTHRGAAIALSWTSSPGVVRSQVVRAPGLRGKKPAPIFSGRRRTFVDRKITSGGRYWYKVRLFDQAGNVASTTVGLKPAVGIFSPAEGSTVTRPPKVSWSAVKRARFYNVQLWRGRVKVMTTWPTSTALTLPRTWKLSGRRQRLADGRYRVFVWPAFGTPKKPGYGKLIGQVTFVVKR